MYWKGFEMNHYYIETNLDEVALQWTTEPPTREGWYWASVDVVGIEARIIVHYPYPSNENVDKITHWLGPLPIPELPR